MKSIIQGVLEKDNLNINKEYAIIYLGGNQNLYYKTNHSFIINCSSFADDILFYLTKKQYEELYLLIHRIKGISCYIGSKELFDCSENLCLRIKNKDYNIKEDVEIYCTFLKKIIEYKKKENAIYLNEKI